MKNETAYLDLLKNVLENGTFKPDRTGTGTLSVFGRQQHYDISEDFPLLTTKKVNFKAILVELIWFLMGQSNIQFLLDHNVHIWDEWADKNGDLGPVYGAMWRRWPTPQGGHIDQIERLERGLKQDPFSRRHIISAWNVAEVDKMALPPCHTLCQFYVSTNNELSCSLYQRSADLFLGVPFNIASYSLLTYMLAHVHGFTPKSFVHTIGDAHIYLNHKDQVEEQLSRTPLNNQCSLRINPLKEFRSVLDFALEDFELVNYQSLPFIRAPISV